MPNQDLTEIICVIDRSGSMDSIKTDAIGGFNSFINEQKKVPGEARLTLVLFNDGYEFLHEGIPLEDVPPLDETTFVPAGMTALLDAVGRTIDSVGERLSKTPEPERPSQVIMAILTDGEENHSTEYTREQVFQRITHQRDVYKWEFMFLAANQDAIEEGSKIGIDAADAFNFDATDQGTKAAYMTMSESITTRRDRKKILH